MSQPEKVTKALLQEITWNNDGSVVEKKTLIPVQFNPETLKVAFSNQIVGKDQNGGAAIQFAGKGSTKLSFDLWFDVTAPDSVGKEDDVRKLTQKIVKFMKPEEKKKKKKTQFIPPGVRFLWGTFLFEGVMESVSETLEFFSAQGKPLRASVSVSLSKQDTEIKINPNASNHGTLNPGREPQEPVRQGDSVQSIAARAGRTEEWQQIAVANNIENPRNLSAGTLLNI